MYPFCSIWTREVGEYSDRLLERSMNILLPDPVDCATIINASQHQGLKN